MRTTRKGISIDFKEIKKNETKKKVSNNKGVVCYLNAWNQLGFAGSDTLELMIYPGM